LVFVLSCTTSGWAINGIQADSGAVDYLSTIYMSVSLVGSAAIADLCDQNTFSTTDTNQPNRVVSEKRKEGNVKIVDDIIRIGVLSHDSHRCHAKWAPTADYLTKKIPEYSFKMVACTHEQVHSLVSSGQIDFVLATPSVYVELETLYQAVRIATIENEYKPSSCPTCVSAVLFCRRDRTDLQQLADIKGHSLMGYEEQTSTAWHLVRLEFLENNIDSSRDFVNISFGTSGGYVVQAVRSGAIDIGAIRSDCYERMKATGQIKSDEFKVLHKESKSHDDFSYEHSTHCVPDRPLAKVHHTSDELAEKVAVALIDMPSGSPAAKASKIAGWTIPHNYQKVHDCLKALRLSPYENYGKVTLADIFIQYRSWIMTIMVLAFLFLSATTIVLILSKKLSNAKQKILEHQITQISDNHYRTFSQNLHDGLGQRLTGIKFMTDTLKGKLTTESSEHSLAKKISELVHGALYMSRDLARGLDPLESSHDDLFSATENMIRNIENTFDVSCVLKHDPSIVIPDRSEANHIYRIIQEAILNSIKHGKAKNVYIAIQDLDGEYVLEIKDDGVGFQDKESQGEGLGLHIMKYRASAMRADLEINNCLEGGVVVRCAFPKKELV
jgi:signal transduction histidine kinase